MSPYKKVYIFAFRTEFVEDLLLHHINSFILSVGLAFTSMIQCENLPIEDAEIMTATGIIITAEPALAAATPHEIDRSGRIVVPLSSVMKGPWA